MNQSQYHMIQGSREIIDKRTNVWSRPSCIYTQIFRPKKTGFSIIINTFQKTFDFFFTFILCNFSVRTLKNFQKKLKNFCFHENIKKQASKVAHNRPRPLYFTVQPRPTAHSPELILHIVKSWDQTFVSLSVC